MQYKAALKEAGGQKRDERKQSNAASESHGHQSSC